VIKILLKCKNVERNAGYLGLKLKTNIFYCQWRFRVLSIVNASSNPTQVSHFYSASRRLDYYSSILADSRPISHLLLRLHKAKLHYAIQVADLVADPICDQVSDKFVRVCD